MVTLLQMEGEIDQISEQTKTQKKHKIQWNCFTNMIFFGRTPTAIAPGCDVAKIYEKVWHSLIIVPYLNKYSICFLRIAPIYQITFGTCTKSSQPNSADTYHMEVLFCFVYLFLFYVHFATFSLQPNTALDEVTVNQDGLYKVLFHTVYQHKQCTIVHL